MTLEQFVIEQLTSLKKWLKRIIVATVVGVPLFFGIVYAYVQITEWSNRAKYAQQKKEKAQPFVPRGATPVEKWQPPAEDELIRRGDCPK